MTHYAIDIEAAPGFQHDRGQRLSVDLTAERLRLHLHPCAAARISATVGGTVNTMAAGDTREFPLIR